MVYLYWMLTALDVENFGTTKNNYSAICLEQTQDRHLLVVKLAKLFCIECCAHYDYFERICGVGVALALGVVWLVSNFLDFLEVGNKEICPQGSFVRFVHDDDAVVAEGGVRHELAHDHAVREVFDPCLGGRFLVEADGVSHEVANGTVLLRRDAVGEGGCSDFTRLGDSDHAVSCETALEDVLRNLCRGVRPR